MSVRASERKSGRAYRNHPNYLKHFLCNQLMFINRALT